MFPHSTAHAHTTFCDGKNTPEEMVQAAIQRGFVSLGLSIHGYTPYEVCDLSMDREAAYRAEVHRLAHVYGDRIEIICGAERDCAYRRSFEGFDYVIESAHYLPYEGEYMGVDGSDAAVAEAVGRLFGGDYYAYCREYFRLLCRVYENSDAAFAGHIDLVTKFNEGMRLFDEGDPRYLKPAMEACEAAVRRGLPIEINTGAISRGYRTQPYPSPALLTHIRKIGGSILINSDAHFARAIDCGYDIAAALARECGFRSVLRLRAAGWEEVGL